MINALSKNLHNKMLCKFNFKSREKEYLLTGISWLLFLFLLVGVSGGIKLF